MSPRPIQNLPASVLARLRDRARQTAEDYQVILGAFVCERFLYRLGVSDAADRFVLKGAMLLRLWEPRPYRATRDLDLMRSEIGAPEAIRADIEAICRVDVAPDGLVFDRASIHLEEIRPSDEFVGTRVTLLARCGNARINLQVDIGAADAVWPPPERRVYPALLGFPAPAVLVYAPASVVAEKLEAIIVLGERNSRIKDFFDLQYLAGRFEFDRATLAEAVGRTLARRQTPLPAEDPVGLSADYWEDPSRLPQIRAFARRVGIEAGPESCKRILGDILPFLLPILDDLRRGVRTAGKWTPGGPWQ